MAVVSATHLLAMLPAMSSVPDYVSDTACRRHKAFWSQEPRPLPAALQPLLPWEPVSGLSPGPDAETKYSQQSDRLSLDTQGLALFYTCLKLTQAFLKAHLVLNWKTKSKALYVRANKN